MNSIDFIKKQMLLGDISFLENMNSIDIDYFVQIFYGIEKEEKNKLLSLCFDSLTLYFPTIAFRLVFFLEEYVSFCKEFLEKDCSIFANYRIFNDFLGSTQWSVTYVSQHLDDILIYEDNIFICLQYAIYKHDLSLLNQLFFYDDMHIRGLILWEFVQNFSSFLPNVMSHIAKYFVSKEGKLLEEEIVSKIACFILMEFGQSKYILVRDFIFQTYEKNHLAFYLDQLSDKYPHFREVLIKDISLLYEKSSDYKWMLYKKYAPYLDINVCKADIIKVKPFYLLSGNYLLEHMCVNGMTDDFLALADKYLEMSVGAKTVTCAGVGSCAYAFKVGDYVIKYSTKKYSLKEDFPQLFLILKNLEEIIQRDKNGRVTSAIEVQQYLSRPLESTRRDLLVLFRQELNRLGYILEDKLVDGTCGVNCFYLNDYHDADFKNPEELPEWFKKDPIVLVDRDLVIPEKKLQYR